MMLNAPTRRPVGFAALAVILGTTTLTSSALGEGSEVPDGSVVIPSIPFSDTGNTADNNNDMDSVCPYSGSTAPDVFYEYTPTANERILITLCASNYDTKTYVMDDTFNVIACNDDGCAAVGGDAIKSRLACVELTADLTYYIAVDGWGTDAGPYTIDISPQTVQDCPDCPVACPPGATPEDEPCGTDTNGGCNTDPNAPVFTDIACGQTICGSAYEDDEVPQGRDTDWYRIVVTEPTIFTLEGAANHPFFFGVMETTDPGNITCQNRTSFVTPFALAGACELATVVTECYPPGEYWFFVAPDFVDGVTECTDPDGPIYTLTLTCDSSSCSAPCELDLDGNGNVGFTDLLLILSNWGPCP